MNKNNQPEHFNKTKLKEREWTDSAIKKFMPTHDREKRNPRYRKAPKMKLYLIERVKKIEQTQEFQDRLVKSRKRSAAMRKSADVRRQKTLELVNEIVFSVPVIEKNELIELACKSYNDFRMKKKIRHGVDFEVLTKKPSKLLDRACVNYLRHNMSSYDNKLDDIFRKVGKLDAMDIIRAKIYRKIGEVYPYLFDECELQLEQRLENTERKRLGR